MAEEMNGSNKNTRPIIALMKEDVGNLDSVLRGYYRSQIKSLEKRKDRKLARRLLQDHLVLPKSRQRTSKDAAYIKEILGIDVGLLEKLEESRLIRRIHKSGANPIYEVSHDTLVEPILAERSNRLAVSNFIKRTWKYIALLLLLWFLFGMLFENTFEVIPDFLRKPQRLDVVMNRQVIGVDEDQRGLVLPLPPVILDQELKPLDSIMIQLPLDPVDLARLRDAERGEEDTISILFANPIEVPLSEEGLPDTYQSFKDVVVPLSLNNANENETVYARVSGNLKMVTQLSNTNTNLGDRGDAGEEAIPDSYEGPLSRPIEIELGDTSLPAAKYAQSVPVNFTFQLSDLFESQADKNNIRNIIGDRQVKLNYRVRVGAAPSAPPPPKIELPSVQGIEVQYSDGSKRFIPNNSTSGTTGTETVHVVVAGETLFSIAKKYNLKDEFGNTSTKAIVELNGLQNNAISVGQVLRIPNQ